MVVMDLQGIIVLGFEIFSAIHCTSILQKDTIQAAMELNILAMEQKQYKELYSTLSQQKAGICIHSPYFCVEK
jgi:uncharacterized membrane protein